MSIVKVMSVVGARPNFMKIAPFIHAIHAHNKNRSPLQPRLDHYLVHTGQHYDVAMSETFFQSLRIPAPDVDLGIGSGTHAEQVGQTMIAFEKVVRQWRPDWVVVVGDVNATCACSITAKKEHVKLAHIEAGLRSFDLDMPEEINRMVTDRLSDLLFTTDEIADGNLRNEGTAEKRIARVGNIMIDTLESHRTEAEALDLNAIIAQHGLTDAPSAPASEVTAGQFAVMTLHRPSNVDDPRTLAGLMDFVIDDMAKAMPLIWPIHPRTLKNLREFGLWERILQTPAIIVLQPLGYLEMLKLNVDARLMLTDSGGLQEECCVLGTPCLTLRWNTERPATLVEHGGASVLVGNDVELIRRTFHDTLSRSRTPHRPDLWDGRTALRIVERLVSLAG
jgi:UDP-N-acetylglucosamine 2-epimerase (non-hydrolysing)